MATLKLAIAGVGNCASSLVQGLAHYGRRENAATPGLMHPMVGPYGIADVQVVAAFDVDKRKVGRPLEEAVFALPNCTTVFERELPRSCVTVAMGPIHDGIARCVCGAIIGRRILYANGVKQTVAKLFNKCGQSQDHFAVDYG